MCQNSTETLQQQISNSIQNIYNAEYLRNFRDLLVIEAIVTILNKKKHLRKTCISLLMVMSTSTAQ